MAPMTRREIDYDEARLAVARAIVDLSEAGQRGEAVEDDDDVAFVAKAAGLPTGIVTEIVEDLGLKMSAGGEIVYHHAAIERVKAMVEVNLVRRTGAGTTNNTVNVHGGEHVQASAGGSGDMHMTVTYEQVLQQLEQKVIASNLAPEKKSEALSMLRGFVKTAGEAVIKTAIDLGAKGILGP